MIKVLIVDDSAVAREMIDHVLDADPEIEVVGRVRNGLEAIEFLQRNRPDVITMDVHMPGMDGFETTRRIMIEHPVPVVIVTSMLDPQADSVIFRTLEAGALAILQKPPGVGHPDHVRAAAELLQTVRLMSEVRVVRRFVRQPAAQKQPAPERATAAAVKVVAIGASTGGPVVVQSILGSLPVDFPVPLLVVQHMADGFIGGFAEWLDNGSAIRVKLGEQGEELAAATAYIAPAGLEMGVDESGRVTLKPCQQGQSLCPTVSYLFHSVAQRYGKHAIGIILSGMGSDGGQGLKEMRDRGALTIAQDEESSVIFGMPAVAVRLNAVRHLLPPEGIIALLRDVVKRR